MPPERRKVSVKSVPGPTTRRRITIKTQSNGSVDGLWLGVRIGSAHSPPGLGGGHNVAGGN